MLGQRIVIVNEFAAFADYVLPEYFYVPRDAVSAEKESPGTQRRLPVPDRSSNTLFLWGQAIYILSQLLNDGLLHVNELDPIRRYLPSYNRPRRGGRYSAFQVDCLIELLSVYFSVVILSFFLLFFLGLGKF